MKKADMQYPSNNNAFLCKTFWELPSPRDNTLPRVAQIWLYFTTPAVMVSHIQSQKNKFISPDSPSAAANHCSHNTLALFLCALCKRLRISHFNSRAPGLQNCAVVSTDSHPPVQKIQQSAGSQPDCVRMVTTEHVKYSHILSLFLVQDEMSKALGVHQTLHI